MGRQLPPASRGCSRRSAISCSRCRCFWVLAVVPLGVPSMTLLQDGGQVDVLLPRQPGLNLCLAHRSMLCPSKLRKLSDPLSGGGGSAHSVGMF